MADVLRVVVSVRSPSDVLAHDLEVPATTPLRDLAWHIAVALGWAERAAPQTRLCVCTEEGGAALPSEKTLQDLGIWDGATLIIERPPESGGKAADGPASVLLSTAGRHYQLTQARYRVGRRSLSAPAHAEASPLLDLRDEADGSTVSRDHALLICERGDWTLIARETANGTSVNDELLPPGANRVLTDGDRVRFGDVELTFLAAQTN